MEFVNKVVAITGAAGGIGQVLCAHFAGQGAAIEIGRPRIEPELSISSVTTVSRNSVSRSTL